MQTEQQQMTSQDKMTVVFKTLATILVLAVVGYGISADVDRRQHASSLAVQIEMLMNKLHKDHDEIEAELKTNRKMVFESYKFDTAKYKEIISRLDKIQASVDALNKKLERTK